MEQLLQDLQVYHNQVEAFIEKTKNSAWDGEEEQIEEKTPLLTIDSLDVYLVEPTDEKQMVLLNQSWLQVGRSLSKIQESEQAVIELEQQLKIAEEVEEIS
jgi:mannose-1-phosphate guanylyltransferase